MNAWVNGGAGDCSVDGFRHKNGSGSGPMSKKFYRDLQAAGLGPKETVIRGKVFVFPEAEAEWRTARSNPGDAEQKLIAKTRERWRRRAKAAGRAAAASPVHVSKLKLGCRKRSERASQYADKSPRQTRKPNNRRMTSQCKN
jgi:hypothetical protein